MFRLWLLFLFQTSEEEEFVDEFFEDDIRLTVNQAEQLLQDLSKRPKRKLAEPIAKRWPLPILYAFDGSHGKGLTGLYDRNL